MDGIFNWEGHTTWYDASGTTEEGKLPIVILHGGPGATHDYLEDLAVLSRSGRQTILYDQIGCGKSEHLPGAPASWTVDLFKRELAGLLEHLGIDHAYTLLGQSWGGMLAMEHALDHPEGLKGMVVSNSPASIALWVEEANRLREGLPPEVQEVLIRHEAAGTTDDPAYEAAVTVFYERHLCRRVPWPECMVRAFALMDEDPTVYHTMNGPSEFHCIGTIKDWDITDRLHEIDIPTLLISGEYDEATPRVVKAIDDRIPDSEWVLFEGASHSTHLEEPQKYVAAVEGFLDRIEA